MTFFLWLLTKLEQPKHKGNKMRNILILNLGKTKDLLSCSNLISSMKHSDPQLNIEILTFNKHKELTQLIKNVSKIHTLDDEFITKITENPLYSDAFALNSFLDSIENIRSVSWESVINYSNDSVSAYLASSIERNNFLGTFINTSGIARTTDKWSNYQNFVASKMSKQVITTSNLRCHIANTPVLSDIEKLSINPDYSVVAAQNFAKIRLMKGSPATFVVGLNLEASYDDFTIETETYAELIESIEESTDYKVVLLLNGKNFQRKLANELNSRFDNKLISINVDTAAITSVIPNLDAVISTSNDQLMISDLMEIKCIEIKDFNSTHKTATVENADNYVIYQKNSETLASDIIISLNEEFGTELPISSISSENPTYKTINDDLGVFLSQIRGDIEIQQELRYHLERSLHMQLMGYPKNDELIKHIKENTDRDELSSFVTNLRSELTSTVKILLATLRSLKGVKTSRSNLDNFVSYLDTLISSGKVDNMVGSLVRNFEGQIENIEAEDIDHNMKMIEDYLFDLKNNCQLLTNVMSEIVTDQAVETKFGAPTTNSNML